MFSAPISVSPSQYSPVLKHSLPSSLSLSTGVRVHRSCSVKLISYGSKVPTALASSGDGSGNGNGSIGGSGGNGGAGGGGEGGKGNEKVAVMLLPEAITSSESLLADRISETPPFMNWLMQFEGVRQRLLTDHLFVTKVAIECVVELLNQVEAFKISGGGISDIIEALGMAEYRMKCSGNRRFSTTAVENEKHKKKDFFKEPETAVDDVVAALKVHEIGFLDGISTDLGPVIKRMIQFGGFGDENFFAKYSRMKCSGNRFIMIATENEMHRNKIFFQELGFDFAEMMATSKVFGSGILDGILTDLEPAIKMMIQFGGSADFLAKCRMKCSGQRLTMGDQHLL